MPSLTQLAVVIVSANSGHWLPACLSTLLANAGNVTLEVVVVDAASVDDTTSVVRDFPNVGLVSCENRGFAYANNRGLEATTAPLVLFLNPDTEIVNGTLGDIVGELRARPWLGLVGCRQVGAHGDLQYTARYYPSVTRSFCEALGSESWPVKNRLLGERERNPVAYDQETTCDWVVGSFMLARRDAIEAVGGMDERFFLYYEEPDLCLRLARAGWGVAHLPSLTIAHYGGNQSSDRRLAAQLGYSARLYMCKHFSQPRAAAGISAKALGYALRALAPGRGAPTGTERRAMARAALGTLLGLRQPPFADVTVEDLPTSA